MSRRAPRSTLLPYTTLFRSVFGRRELVEGGANAFQLGGLHGLLHDHGVEAQLVAEVIVDRGDVGAGGDADFADGGGAIAPVGKDPPGNVEQLVASGLGG